MPGPRPPPSTSVRWPALLLWEPEACGARRRQPQRPHTTSTQSRLVHYTARDPPDSTGLLILIPKERTQYSTLSSPKTEQAGEGSAGAPPLGDLGLGHLRFSRTSCHLKFTWLLKTQFT